MLVLLFPFLLILYTWAQSFPSDLNVKLSAPFSFIDILKSYVRIIAKIPKRTKTLPAIEITAPLKYSASHLQSYNKQLNFSNEEEFLPPFYLCALTGGLFLLIGGHSKFPLRIMGAVNTSTEVKIHTPVRKQWLENGELRCVGRIGQVNIVKRGMEFEMIIEVYRGNSIVWSKIFRSLIFMKTDESTDKQVYREEHNVENATALETSSIKLPYNAGRIYAKLSHDFNPIHIHNLTAKLFGFPKMIAHGMWVVAKADASGKPLVRRDMQQHVKIFFKKPTFLPAECTVNSYKDKGEGISYGIERLDKKKDNTLVIYGTVTK